MTSLGCGIKKCMTLMNRLAFIALLERNARVSSVVFFGVGGEGRGLGVGADT